MENTSDHRRSHLLQLPGGSWDGVPGLQKGKTVKTSHAISRSRQRISLLAARLVSTLATGNEFEKDHSKSEQTRLSPN